MSQRWAQTRVWISIFNIFWYFSDSCAPGGLVQTVCRWLDRHVSSHTSISGLHMMLSRTSPLTLDLHFAQSFKKGEVICPIEKTLPGTKGEWANPPEGRSRLTCMDSLHCDFALSTRIEVDLSLKRVVTSTAYSSVQVLPDPPLPGQDQSRVRHIELNSDLLYVNHSCAPNVAFKVPSNESEWRVEALEDLAEGTIMTFAYFTTEWDMQQPFECLCGSKDCLGVITGARQISRDVLGR